MANNRCCECGFSYLDEGDKMPFICVLFKSNAGIPGVSNRQTEHEFQNANGDKLLISNYSPTTINPKDEMDLTICSGCFDHMTGHDKTVEYQFIANNRLKMLEKLAFMDDYLYQKHSR